MKKVTLSGWLVSCVFTLMLVGCSGDCGDAPASLAETPETMTWKYAIGDKVLHKSGVLGVVIDIDFSTMAGFGSYAKDEGQWDGKQTQCYRIRIPGKNGLTCDWVSVLELEDTIDE